MNNIDTTNYAAPATMTMRALGPKDIARAFDKWHKRHRVADRETARRVWDAAADYYGRAPSAAIAKPVLAPGETIEQARANFEDWYISHAADSKAAPIGSRDSMLQWSSWIAARSGNYVARDGWKVSPMPWGPAGAPVAGGSVDTGKFRDLLLYHARVREIDDDLIAHIDAWGAQQGAAIKHEAKVAWDLANEYQQSAEKAEADARESGNLAQVRLHRIGELEPKLFDALARVKALEAELAKVNAWYGKSHQIGEELGHGSAIPACDCHACQPITLANNRMILCPTCSNKRCPHAGDHRNACTGSNEPGQPGSAYP